MFRISYLFFLLFPIVILGQTENLGQPVSWSLKLKPVERLMILPTVNNELESQREMNRRNVTSDKRYVFGKSQKVNLDLLKVSEMTTLSNGDVLYRYRVISEHAHSINLVFSTYNLAKGARLYVYDGEQTEFIGAHTFLNNNVQNILGTDLIHSDNIVVELIEPANAIGTSKLVLGNVIHGFRDLESDVKSLNQSGSCMYDVNCPIGVDWKQQRNSVSILINGEAFCSGALVNNTSGIITPYLLTANHCGTTPGSWVFRFRYESPEAQADCATSNPSVDGPKDKNINGAQLKANSAASDFCLVLLNSTPDPAWGVFYSGWDRTGNIPLSGTGIHHPTGDVMKISFDYQPLVSTTTGSSPADSHWEVQAWDDGVTEGGSSGSPIFDQNHRIVGQLHGGASKCGNGPNEMDDSYGKFSVSWTGGGTPQTRLQDWLDPNNIGSTVIDGVDPNAIGNTLDAGVGSIGGATGVVCSAQVTPSFSLINNGSNLLTKATIKYGYDGVLNQTLNWTGSLVKYASEVVTFPLVTLASGTHTFSVDVILANDASDQNSANNNIESSFSVIAKPRIVELNLYTDCWGFETTWNLLNANDQVIVSGGPYTQSTSSVLKTHTFCLTAGCFKFELLDNFSDGMNGGSGCDPSVKGSYTISDEKDVIVAQLPTPDFGASDIQNFCLTELDLGIDELLDSWAISPNPTLGELSVHMRVDGLKLISIIDATGKMVLDVESTEVTQKIQTNTLSNGIYIVQLKVNGLTSFKRLVVQ